MQDTPPLDRDKEGMMHALRTPGRRATGARRLAPLASLALALAVSASQAQLALEEVVVTAQKREQGIQDIPVAVTAMSAEELRAAQVNSITDLTDLNPSVSFDVAQSASQNTSLKIRGIGTFGNGRTFEGAVGTFVDGVYRSRSGMVLGDLLDIARLEVLRGPQGTLFGKNTVAGAILLESVNPNLETMEGYAEARLGNDDEQVLTGAVNTPLGDRAALRLSGIAHERDGYYKSANGDNQNDIDRYALKAKLLFVPTDDLRLQLIVDYADSESRCCYGSVYVDPGPVMGPILPVLAAGNGLSFYANAEDNRRNDLSDESRDNITDRGAAFRLDWDLSDTWSLRSISAYREFEQHQLDADFDFGPADIVSADDPTDISNLSQEFNLAGRLGQTELLGGLYYAHEDYRGDRIAYSGTDLDELINILASAQIGLPCFPSLGQFACLYPPGALVPETGMMAWDTYEQDGDSYAAFAHTTTPLTDTLGLVAGLRYTLEEKDGGFGYRFRDDVPLARTLAELANGLPPGTIPPPFGPINLLGVPPGVPFSDDTSDDAILGTVSLQYAWSEGANLFATYSRGFKAGGVNLLQEAAVENNTTYQPEYADNYELGLKALYWDGRARSNLALFYTEFEDFQINFFTGVAFNTVNADQASTRGLELENSVQLSDALRVDFNLTVLEARFDDISEPLIAYLDGRDTPRAPNTAATLALHYQLPLQHGWTFYAGGSAAFTGEHYVSAEIEDEEKVDGYTIFDARAGVRSASKGWDIGLFCTNCLDETYRTIYFKSPVQPGSFSTMLNTPRYYGLAVRRDF